MSLENNTDSANDIAALKMCRAAIDSLAEGFALYDSDQRLVLCNQAHRDMSRPLDHLLKPGVTREYIVRETAKHGGYQNDIGSEEAWISRQLSLGGHYARDLEMRKPDGTCHLVSVHPTKDGGLVLTCRDATEHKRVEAEKSSSDTLVRSVLETSLAAIVMARTDDGKIIYRSPAATDLFGTIENVSAHYQNPGDRMVYLDLNKADGKVDGFRTELLGKDGDPFPANVSGRMAEYRGEEVIISTIVDLTEQLRAEAHIQKVLDASSAMIAVAKAEDGKILYRTPASQKKLGTIAFAEEFYADPDDWLEVTTKLRSETEANNYDLNLIDGTGQKFPASISGKLATYKNESAIVINIVDLTEQKKTEELISQVLEACQVPIQMTSLKTGNILFSTSATTELFGDVKNSREYYIDTADRPGLLKELREKGWYKDRVAQYVGRDGRKFWNAQSARLLEFRGEEVIVSNTRDLTEDLALQEELKSQREQLFQKEKMSALGELLAGVSHELNNPLSIVVGHSQLLREDATDPDTIRRIEKISGAAERCSKIVKTFLAMARQQPAKMEASNLNSMVSSAVDVASYGNSQKGLQIKCSLDDTLPNVLADADQITQVIINLIINAKQAMFKAGIGDCVQIVTKSGKSAEGNAFAEICVKDNGPGIPENVKPRIFEPFFTTKEVGEGTGIGLAFSHRTILSHGGQIWLDKNHEHGSCFSIRLPVSAAEGNAPQSVEERQQAASKSTALVVDDEPEVAELISEILVLEGFAVDIASSGREAERKLKLNRYDLLLSDLNMPDLDGHDLFKLLKSNHPEMLQATGFITGDTLGRRSQTLLRESNRPHLEKPVTPRGLREFVAEVLKGSD